MFTISILIIFSSSLTLLIKCNTVKISDEDERSNFFDKLERSANLSVKEIKDNSNVLIIVISVVVAIIALIVIWIYFRDDIKQLIIPHPKRPREKKLSLATMESNEQIVASLEDNEEN